MSFSTTNGTSSFLESNSLVAKFAFLLLIIFAFIILFRIGISIMTYFFQPNGSPKLINGMIDATQQLVFYQDPSGSTGKSTIYRSANERDGLEFTWSVWIYIKNLQYLDGRFRHIFYKGDSNLSPNGLNFPNNAPGLYIAPDTNALVVIMNTYNVINEEVIIPDIPLNKWVNIIVRCENNTLDVYINGTISRSVELNGIPKQNFGNVFVAANGGFEGNIADLWYFNHALGTAAIQEIFDNGPKTTLASASMSSTASGSTNDYLSMRWFFYGSGDTYNPSFTPN
jgi:hypothetical protein